MIINLKVKTLDSQTHEFSIDNEITIRQFKNKIAEKTNIAAEQQRIIYCGRVLADDKQVKEYDVDGKVVHVAERPPPSRMTQNTSSTSSTRRNERSETRGMRNSPLFRALDGMVVGAMAIPMNAGVQNQQTSINALTSSSSSFCMNRITVARHMLECANNIAAYLEDPERGLNNTSLDILTQGRWTMESTVVEVGITDIQQNQTHNIVEALQGAVSAALRQNGNANVTVVQLPTVFGTNGELSGEQTDAEDQSANITTGATAPAEPMEPMENITGAIEVESTSTPEPTPTTDEGSATSQSGSNIEQGSRPQPTGAGILAEVIERMRAVQAEPMDLPMENITAEIEVEPTNTPDPDPTPAADEGSATSNSGSTSDQTSRPQRTGVGILAEVIQRMRTVQARLNPFIDQYYDILVNEPTFEENDTTGRENAQRLFDRVSEAFHYLSHAQHAISDLMLDVSRPAPRYLCCRPILVEQSGYVSSNNYMAYNPAGNVPSLHTGSIPRQQAPTASTSPQVAASNASPVASTASTSTAADEAADNDNNDNTESGAMATPPSTPASTTNGAESASTPNGIQGLSANHQLQVARLIQAVVNSAPIDADFHVQINAPSILSIGVPLNATLRQQATPASASTQTSSPSSTQQQPHTTDAATTQTASTTAADSNTNSADLNQARVTTATHPTTSTQTRSTARPQVQVANIPSSWNTRVIPANMLSPFDRFLPCNSHHIRDAEARENGANNNNNSVNQHFNQPRVQTRILRRLRRPNSTSSTGNSEGTTTSTTPTRAQSPSTPSNSSNTSVGQINVLSNLCRNNGLRNQLVRFIAHTMFDGAPVSESGMPAAVEKAIQYLNDILIFLPQYDMHEYNSRASVEKLVRESLPLIIDHIHDPRDLAGFETQLSKQLKQLFARLFVILFVCVGRLNAQLYWSQIMNILLQTVYTLFNEPALRFLQLHIKTRTPDVVDEVLVDDVKQFLVLRDASATLSNNEVTPMDTDSCSASGSASSSCNFELLTVPPSEPDEILPPVALTEPFHRHFPPTWVPILTHDIRQIRRTTQPAFSDAYISGMSAKRRKLIQSTKPPTDLKSLVADSVRRAIQTTGIQNPSISNSTHSADEISNAIAADSTVQASFCETLRSGVKERLKTDSDFNADNFPHTSKYFNKQN